MKRYYSILAILLVTTSLFAYDFTAPDTNGNTIYYSILGGDSVEVTRDDSLAYSYIGAIIIPETVTYNTTLYHITGIAKNAFSGNSKLTSVSLPESITTIPTAAFAACTKLTSVQWSENVTEIQDSAFCGCSVLKDVIWTNNIQKIGLRAFQGSKVEQVYLPASLVSINATSFFKCSKLTQVDVDPNNQAYCSIDGVLFSKDQKLLYYFPSGQGGEYYVPEGVIKIGNNAFNQASFLEKVVLPNSVDTINGWAFSNCAMKVIDLGKEMHYIGEGALNTCKNLTYLKIPHGISILPQSSVSGCPNLKKVIFPSTLDTIIGGMFWGCTKMDTIISLAAAPPKPNESHVFFLVPTSTVLQVPLESIDRYKGALFWRDFAITGLSYATNITPSSAVIKWVPDVDVAEYTISLYTSDTLFRQYLVDGDGKLITQNNTPLDIRSIKMDTTYTTDDYYVLTMDDLDEKTDYNYTIYGQNSSKVNVYHEEGSFTTTSSENLMDPAASDPKKPRKILRNGQIFILKGENIYTIQGQNSN